nr:hypothetical protein CFP56_66803 [Quercus suber]
MVLLFLVWQLDLAAAAEAIAGESVRLRVLKEMGVEHRNVSSHCSVERQRFFDGVELDGGGRRGLLKILTAPEYREIMFPLLIRWTHHEYEYERRNNTIFYL